MSPVTVLDRFLPFQFGDHTDCPKDELESRLCFRGKEGVERGTEENSGDCNSYSELTLSAADAVPGLKGL